MTAAAANGPDSAAVWRTLGGILDPEFAVSIVDLGLIYSVECQGGNVHVVMTLTTPTCPAGAWIHEGVRAAIGRLDGARAVRVDLVYDPAWNAAMISAEGRRQLGWPAEA